MNMYPRIPPEHKCTGHPEVPFVEVRKEVKENRGKHDLIYAIHLDYLFIRAHSNY